MEYRGVRTLRVMLVIGARPQIVKSAPIIHEASKDAEVKFQLVHTEQRYARATQLATFHMFLFLGNHKVDGYRNTQENYSLENQIRWYNIQISSVTKKDIQHSGGSSLQTCNLGL